MDLQQQVRSEFSRLGEFGPLGEELLCHDEAEWEWSKIQWMIRGDECRVWRRWVLMHIEVHCNDWWMERKWSTKRRCRWYEQTCLDSWTRFNTIPDEVQYESQLEYTNDSDELRVTFETNLEDSSPRKSKQNQKKTITIWSRWRKACSAIGQWSEQSVINLMLYVHDNNCVLKQC